MKRSLYTLLIALLVSFPIIVYAASFWSPFSGGGGIQGTSILDANGNTSLALTATGSAVNYMTLANLAASTSTTGPVFSATGTSGAIAIVFTPKGTGNIILNGPTYANGVESVTFYTYQTAATTWAWMAKSQKTAWTAY